MADSQYPFGTIATGQGDQVAAANALLDACSPAALFGRSSASTGLTWGFHGGHPTLSDGSLATISSGTVALTASATNYVVALKSSGAVSVATTNTNWNNTTDYWRLYIVTTNTTGPVPTTGIVDYREIGKMTGAGGSGGSVTAKDEGSSLTTALSSLDFVGVGVTATTSGNNVTVTVPGLSGALQLNTQTDSYTLVIGDSGKYVRMNKATANNLTVPPNSSVAFATGSQVHVRQVGAGQTTIVAGSGVTITTPETLKLRKQHAAATLVKVDTDGWELMGDLEAA